MNNWYDSLDKESGKSIRCFVSLCNKNPLDNEKLIIANIWSRQESYGRYKESVFTEIHSGNHYRYAIPCEDTLPFFFDEYFNENKDSDNYTYEGFLNSILRRDIDGDFHVLNLEDKFNKLLTKKEHRMQINTNSTISVQKAEEVGISETFYPKESEESESQKKLFEKILNTINGFNDSVQNVIIEFGKNVKVHNKHYREKEVFASYTYEDKSEMTCTKRKYLLAKFPLKETYRSLITSILDEFWTPYDPKHSTEKLEKQLETLFNKMDIEIVIFEQASAKLSNKAIKKLLSLLNENLKVSVVFVNIVV